MSATAPTRHRHSPTPTHGPVRPGSRGALLHTYRATRELNHDFDLLSETSRAREAVGEWRRELPGLLEECRTLADVIAMGRSKSSIELDPLLFVLLREAHDGCEIAGRLALQMMLGAAVRTGLRGYRRTVDDEEALHLAIAYLWELIATYPLDRRPTRIAANLAMDLLGRLTRHASHCRQSSANEVAVPLDELELKMSRSQDELASNADAFRRVLEALAWAADREVISREEAALLLRVYSPGPGEASGAALAAEYGLSWAGLRQRVSRLSRRLAAALAESHAAAA